MNIPHHSPPMNPPIQWQNLLLNSLRVFAPSGLRSYRLLIPATCSAVYVFLSTFSLSVYLVDLIAHKTLEQSHTLKLLKCSQPLKSTLSVLVCVTTFNARLALP